MLSLFKLTRFLVYVLILACYTRGRGCFIGSRLGEMKLGMTRLENQSEKYSLDTALSFKTTSIILVILRKTIIFAHSDAGSTASGVSFYRSYKIIFVGGNQMRQRSFFDFRLNFRYAKIRFILLIYNFLHV